LIVVKPAARRTGTVGENGDAPDTMGTVDRAIRAALGLVPLATATMGWCPAYLPFGFSTCATKPGA
jgi:hypothetical protein